MGYKGGSIRENFRISESKSVTINYPKSETGGSVTRSVDFTADVHINVDAFVDSDPFDNSVAHCRSRVTGLTSAVVATEAAEVAAKRMNSRKVGSSLVEGFFGYIRSDISQQIAQLKIQAESILMHLLKLKEQMIAKQHQMQKDYMRIRDRYEDTFKELDKEVSTRIRQIDRPSFLLNEHATEQLMRSQADTLLNTVTIFGGESSRVQSLIYGSGLKMRSLAVLRSADKFITDSHKLNREIESVLTDNPQDSTLFAPVLEIEVNDENEGLLSGIYHSPLTSFESKEDMSMINRSVETFNKRSERMSTENQQMIGNYLKEEISKNLNANNAHDERVIKLVNKFWRDSKVEVYSD